MVLLCLLPLRAGAADFDSFAFVNDDGTLSIRNATIHLYGILIPPTDQDCHTFVRPVSCGPRAVIALKFDIGTNFVHCNTKSQRPDGSYVAVCRAGGRNLSEWLLQQGWAAALPDAPYEYQVLEKIARGRGLGIWGLSVHRRGDIHPAD